MKHIAKTLICTAILVAASASGCARHNPTPSDTSAVAVSTPYCAVTPKLKYKHAGSLSNWTEESYYNAPVVTDLDDDGNLEIVFSNYSITVLDASSGSTKWRVNSGHDRTEDFAEFGKSVGHTWCDAEVIDIDGDGSKEVITVHGNGLISVLDKNGYFKPGWPQNPSPGAPARSVKAADLDGDGKVEIVVGYAMESTNNTIYVYNYDGTVRAGWPQLSYGADGNTQGMYMSGLHLTDLDGDGTKEILAATDLSSISAFHHDGSQVRVNSSVYGSDVWSNIPLYEDYNTEIKRENGLWGYPLYSAYESREKRYRAELGQSRIISGDVDGDGREEIAVTAIICDRYAFEQNGGWHYDSKYMTVALLNSDRTRYQNAALDADWSTLPIDTGKPLTTSDVSLALNVSATPVMADLDGDGLSEILFNSYDGKVHCFSLNKTEPYAWPYSLTKRTSPQYEYASPVACADIDFDGKMEVIFASTFDKTQNLTEVTNGYLYILNYEGKLLSKTELPPAKEAVSHNGVTAAPVVADIDGDGRYEVVLNTQAGAICVYDLD